MARTVDPHLLRAVPGRARLHVPGLSAPDAPALETALQRVPGVRAIEAHPLTGTVLVLYDRQVTNDGAVLDAARAFARGVPHGPVREDGDATARERQQAAPAAYTRSPRVIASGRGGATRARIAVRGLDRDPDLARRVVERLERRPGVHARANPLTGRVLVEFDAHQEDIRDLLSAVEDVELPDLPGEDNPAHPLDPAPLVQSATRTTGATIGLGLVAARQVAGVTVTAPGAAQVSGVIGIVQGFPATRNGLRAILGRNVSDLLFSGANIVALALSGSPLGLTVTGLESLRLLTEVVARRRAFTRYEERLGDAADAEPGATIHLEAGERSPLAATIDAGTGTAIARDGAPVSIGPGTTISAGARVQGGPFVVTLRADRPFTPQPRPASPTPALPDRYQKALGPVSLAYAVGVGVVTRSPGRVFEALLLVNPRAALVGAESASLSAGAHVLRAGVTVAGSRPDRGVRLPQALVVDGPRVLTDGIELTGVVPLTETRDVVDVQSLAGGVAAAAGSPWGAAFRAAGGTPAIAGSFDGTTAGATIGGARYTLGPLQAGENLPAADRLRGRGATLVALRGGDGRPLALFALRARLAPGMADLVAACRRHEVEIGLIGRGEAARAVAHRADVPLLDEETAVAAVRARQENGARVAVLSDSAHTAEAFDACDLAIGLTSGRGSRFPARADLLAPDPAGVVSIIEAGAQREATARDSVGFSVLANIAGALWGVRGGAGIERASFAVYAATLGALADGWLRLRGGKRAPSTVARLVDPRPERWGARDVEDVLKTLQATDDGLTSAEALQRQRAAPKPPRRHELLRAVLDQLRSPLVGILAAGAGLSLALGSPLDFALIGATIGVNVAVGAWQERRAGQAAAALERLGAATARVRRDGAPVTVPASDVVPGDVLVLQSGDRVAADARLLEARNLEVDEASLTGESLPVPKAPNGGTDASRVVLEGSDVTVGTGRAVASRLAGRDALVRRLGAVEALGRVDVACTDKTGTLTEGKLALTLVADVHADAPPSREDLPSDLRAVLRAAGLASPRPDATDAGVHFTDVAVVRGAVDAGLDGDLRVERTAEAPFDPVRAFHATIVGDRLYAKGASEALLPRCDRVRDSGVEKKLDEAGRQALRDRAEDLAGRGLRVLMVADGDAQTPVDDPRGLVALGFVGISDPLRPDVPAAVRRCQEAGVRVIMLTGDSPATARAIAGQAGLLDGGDVLTGAAIAELQNGDLDRRLERAAVIARVTPLDKLRIVESLQRHGHIVAMTGDGVNDAPALRLADVGVAMGRGGTEVARQAADVVLADDDFATLVEALVEGRSFWRNIRRALGLLLGGNLGGLRQDSESRVVRSQRVGYPSAFIGVHRGGDDGLPVLPGERDTGTGPRDGVGISPVPLSSLPADLQ